MEIIKHDIVVFGAGGAGLRAAVEAARAGKNVAVVSKVHPMRVQTTMATSLNAAFREGDNWEDHVFDTVKGSDYMGDEDAITYLCSHGKEDTLEMERFGLLYSREADGNYTKKTNGSGGQRFPRSIFTADRTGHSIIRTLYGFLQQMNVTIYDEWYVTKIVVKDGAVRGLCCINLKDGRLYFLQARAVIVATGGYGQVYYPRSTNALSTTGDGMALAFRAGVRLLDMEFVQFHPTSLFGTNILMSEACRSSGAYLLNNKGERFMSKYAPEKIELATRDVVSRGIQSEIELGNGINGKEYVYLDLRHLGEKKILHYLPKNRDLAIRYIGRDMIKEPIPIQPAQHYSMGGIETNIDTDTSIAGLFASGETACVSVQGANRLGGNSVLEVIVFGKRSGSRAAEVVDGLNEGEVPWAEIGEEEGRLKGILKNSSGNEHGLAIKRELGRIMNTKVGIFRQAEDIQKAIEEVKALRQRVGGCVVNQKSDFLFNYEVIDRLELDNMTMLAEMISTCALAREESRGSHFRRDFPKRDDENWGNHTTLTNDGNGGFTMGTKPVVHIKHMPAVRTY